MENKVKPIQATPTLNEEDSKKIIKEAMIVPSEDAVTRNEKRLQDAKRIFSLEAGGDNRDGYALRYAYRKLETIPAETRLLLVISDGAPCDSTSDGVSYHMHNGAADMKRAVSEAIKKGLKTIVAGLGSDAPYIKACYKEGVSEQNSAQFLDVSDIEKMPKTFVKILKNYLE